MENLFLILVGVAGWSALLLVCLAFVRGASILRGEDRDWLNEKMRSRPTARGATKPLGWR